MVPDVASPGSTHLRLFILRDSDPCDARGIVVVGDTDVAGNLATRRALRLVDHLAQDARVVDLLFDDLVSTPAASRALLMYGTLTCPPLASPEYTFSTSYE